MKFWTSLVAIICATGSSVAQGPLSLPAPPAAAGYPPFVFRGATANVGATPVVKLRWVFTEGFLPDGKGFNVYRISNGTASKINTVPITVAPSKLAVEMQKLFAVARTSVAGVPGKSLFHAELGGVAESSALGFEAMKQEVGQQSAKSENMFLTSRERFGMAMKSDSVKEFASEVAPRRGQDRQRVINKPLTETQKQTLTVANARTSLVVNSLVQEELGQELGLAFQDRSILAGQKLTYVLTFIDASGDEYQLQTIKDFVVGADPVPQPPTHFGGLQVGVNAVGLHWDQDKQTSDAGFLCHYTVTVNGIQKASNLVLADGPNSSGGRRYRVFGYVDHKATPGAVTYTLTMTDAFGRSPAPVQATVSVADWTCPPIPNNIAVKLSDASGDAHQSLASIPLLTWDPPLDVTQTPPAVVPNVTYLVYRADGFSVRKVLAAVEAASGGFKLGKPTNSSSSNSQPAPTPTVTLLTPSPISDRTFLDKTAQHDHYYRYFVESVYGTDVARHSELASAYTTLNTRAFTPQGPANTPGAVADSASPKSNQIGVPLLTPPPSPSAGQIPKTTLAMTTPPVPTNNFGRIVNLPPFIPVAQPPMPQFFNQVVWNQQLVTPETLVNSASSAALAGQLSQFQKQLLASPAAQGKEMSQLKGASPAAAVKYILGGAAGEAGGATQAQAVATSQFRQRHIPVSTPGAGTFVGSTRAVVYGTRTNVTWSLNAPGAPFIFTVYRVPVTSQVPDFKITAGTYSGSAKRMFAGSAAVHRVKFRDNTKLTLAPKDALAAVTDPVVKSFAANLPLTGAVKLIGTTSGNTITDSDLVTGILRTFDYIIVARDQWGNESQPTLVPAVIPPSANPDAPLLRNCIADPEDPLKVHILFDPPEPLQDVRSYQVFRVLTGSKSPDQIVTLLGAANAVLDTSKSSDPVQLTVDSTSGLWVLTDLSQKTPLTEYGYAIRGVNSLGLPSARSAYLEARTWYGKPGVPTVKVQAGPTGIQLIVSPGTNTHEGFTIFVRRALAVGGQAPTNSNQFNQIPVTLSPANVSGNTTATDVNVITGQTYVYQVKVKDAFSKLTSDWTTSAVVTAK